MLRLQLQTMGSGAVRCRTPPPARHRARCKGLTTGLSVRSCSDARRLSCARFLEEPRPTKILPAMGYIDSRNLARARGLQRPLLHSFSSGARPGLSPDCPRRGVVSFRLQSRGPAPWGTSSSKRHSIWDLIRPFSQEPKLPRRYSPLPRTLLHREIRPSDQYHPTAIQQRCSQQVLPVLPWCCTSQLRSRADAPARSRLRMPCPQLG